MTVKSNTHSGRLLLLILGLFVLSLAVGLMVASCSSDKEKTEGTEEDTGLPADYGEKALLDTTTTAQKPAQKPAVQQPTQKPPTTQQAQTKPTPQPPKPQVVKTTVLEANTSMLVTLNTQVSTSESKVGDKVTATVKGPSETGQTLNIPAGTILEGVVADVNDGKAEGTKAFLKLKFTSMTIPGQGAVPMEGIVVTKDGSGVIYPGAQGTSIARDAGIGAVAGGVIGGVTGGEAKDAVKGAAIGAVAGGVLGAVLHKDQVTLKVGREFDVVTTAPVVKETTK